MSQRRTMAGQAMVLGLVMLLVLCVGVIVLFDTGQTVNKKVELVNAADAAAYSVAVQQARALNFAAYSNRARVANEVAVAQVIGLYSWMNQFHTTTIVLEKVMSVLAKIPYVGPIFQALSSIFKAIGQTLKGIRRAYHGLAQVTVTALDALNGTLATASRSILEAVGRVDGILVARDIVKRNSADAALSAVGAGVLTSQLVTANNNFLQSYRIPRSRGGGAGGSAQDRRGA
ncbi:pilus assembly protein TadG-related protein, partial [Stenotrophomonas sp. MH1]